MGHLTTCDTIECSVAAILSVYGRSSMIRASVKSLLPLESAFMKSVTRACSCGGMRMRCMYALSASARASCSIWSASMLATRLATLPMMSAFTVTPTTIHADT